MSPTKISFVIEAALLSSLLLYTQQEKKEDLIIFPGLVRHWVSLNLEKPKGVPRVALRCNLALGPRQSSSGFLGRTWTSGWTEKAEVLGSGGR